MMQPCSRCGGTLLPESDIVNSVRYNYYSCFQCKRHFGNSPNLPNLPIDKRELKVKKAKSAAKLSRTQINGSNKRILNGYEKHFANVIKCGFKDELYTITEISEKLGVTKPCITQWIAKGLESELINGLTWINGVHLLQYFKPLITTYRNKLKTGER